MIWSIKHGKCINCFTTLLKHKAKGYCTKCYPIIKKIEAVDSVDENELYSLRVRYLSVKHPLNNDLTEKTLLKSAIKESIRGFYLSEIELYGKIENDVLKVDILRLEFIFNKISRKVNGNDRFYNFDLTTFQTNFSQEQRKKVALKLLKMLILRK